MILEEHQTIFPTRDPTTRTGFYTPQDYDGHFHTGFPMTVRNAIANSFNLPALDGLEFAGIPNVLNTAGRLGITEVSNRNPRTLCPSLALGSAWGSLLDLTCAYAPFATRGVRVPTTSIL